jgi:hypothetical protein
MMLTVVVHGGGGVRKNWFAMRKKTDDKNFICGALKRKRLKMAKGEVCHALEMKRTTKSGAHDNLSISGSGSLR